jgi:hypothetical protein
MLKCANYFRQINQSYSNGRVYKSFAGPTVCTKNLEIKADETGKNYGLCLRTVQPNDTDRLKITFEMLSAGTEMIHSGARFYF